MEQLLNELGVASFTQLAAFDDADIDRVDQALDEFPGRIVRDDWVGQAREIVGLPARAGTGGVTGGRAANEDSTAVRAPRKPLFATPAKRDDLTRISGIGPVMEELLNELGVASFAQLAAFDQSDIDRVDAALEDFPGRVERDDWVGQARTLTRGN